MPNSMLDLDTNFPNLSGEQSTDAKLMSIQNYLYMLVEQLRYSLRNLDLTNWNSAALSDWTGSITGPIYGRIEDGEGRMNQFQLDAEGLRGRISDAEGNISSLQADAEGFRAAISDAQGNITQLQADAEGLKSSVSDAEGRLSVVEQKADSVTTTVGELGGSFTQLQQTVNGFTFTDEQGKVWIDNGSLRLTGSITWADLNSSVQNSINNAGISEATARSIANSVASTVITSTLVASPTIIGANIYGSKIWAGDSRDSYMILDEDGLRMYINGIDEPKFEFTIDKASSMPLVTIGAGGSTGKNRFYLTKYPTSMTIHYDTTGMTFSSGAISITSGTTLNLTGVTVTGFTPKFT